MHLPVSQRRNCPWKRKLFAKNIKEHKTTTAQLTAELHSHLNPQASKTFPQKLQRQSSWSNCCKPLDTFFSVRRGLCGSSSARLWTQWKLLFVAWVHYRCFHIRELQPGAALKRLSARLLCTSVSRQCWSSNNALIHTVKLSGLMSMKVNVSNAYSVTWSEVIRKRYQETRLLHQHNIVTRPMFCQS